MSLVEGVIYMKKVILIGIDGATPYLIEKWIRDGKLPNFQKIQGSGVWGRLKSTIPPFSAPAWTSIVTGCNPGKHGIYGFESTGTLEQHIISSRHRKVPAVWNFLTDIGLKNIVVNVPGSYPPEEINGIMITGLLTPSLESNFTYPSYIKQRLKKDDLGNYELEQLWLEDYSRSRIKKHAPQKLLDTINRQLESRAQVALNLMKESDWNFTMVVFRGTDTAQHFLFENKNLLLLCYQKVDEIIGTIMEKIPDALFFIVSDHGFEEIDKMFYPDNVLYNAGYLKPSRDLHDSFTSKFIFLINHLLGSFLKLLPQKTLKESKLIKKLLFSGSSKSNLIDFSKTKAFSTADGRGIQICHKDRYIDGIVMENDYEQVCNEISTLLKGLKDPKDGSKIVKNVYKWYEIYGKDAVDPPDLVFDLKDGITAAEWLRFSDKISNIMHANRRNIPFLFDMDPIGRTGDHSQYGIFLAFGEGIKTNYQVDNMSVEDVLPTIFAAMNIPIPNIVDGKIRDNIFSYKPVTKRVDWKTFSSGKKTLTKGEVKKIQELKRKLK